MRSDSPIRPIHDWYDGKIVVLGTNDPAPSSGWLMLCAIVWLVVMAWWMAKR